MGTFLHDAHEAMEALFAHEPFKSLRDRFHIIAVKSPSADSGTSIPRLGIWRHTILQSHFDTFYSDRYLTTLNLKDLHNCLAGTPYEHIIVLVNSEQYGGGGILNSYNLSTTHHRLFKPVVVHEFGHSFAGLGDARCGALGTESHHPGRLCLEVAGHDGQENAHPYTCVVEPEDHRKTRGGVRGRRL